MDKFKRWVWIGLAVALAAAVGALFWPRQGDEEKAEAIPPRIVLPGHPPSTVSLAFFRTARRSSARAMTSSFAFGMSTRANFSIQGASPAPLHPYRPTNNELL